MITRQAISLGGNPCYTVQSEASILSSDLESIRLPRSGIRSLHNRLPKAVRSGRAASDLESAGTGSAAAVRIESARICIAACNTRRSAGARHFSVIQVAGAGGLIPAQKLRCFSGKFFEGPCTSSWHVMEGRTCSCDIHGAYERNW